MSNYVLTATPVPTPPTVPGQTKFFIDSADTHFKTIDNAGLITDISTLVGLPQTVGIAFGGRMTVDGNFAVANGEANVNSLAAPGPRTKQPVPKNGQIRRVGFISETGDLSSAFRIFIQGVDAGAFTFSTIAVGGGSETVAVPVLAGQSIEIEKVSGTNSGDTTFLLVLEFD